MSDKIFLDTNIIVYAYDTHEPQKQREAQILLTTGIEEESVVISVQVLGEFFNVITRRIKQPMSPDEAQEIIASLSVLSIEDIDLSMVNRAISIHKGFRISYWDALIVATAERAKCTKILSEDLNHGQIYNGILVSNPFKTEQIHSSEPSDSE